MKFRHIMLVSGLALSAQVGCVAHAAATDTDVECRYVMGQLTDGVISNYKRHNTLNQVDHRDAVFQFFFATMTWEMQARADGLSSGEIDRRVNTEMTHHVNIDKADINTCLNGAMQLLNAMPPQRYNFVLKAATGGFISMSHHAGITIPDGFFKKYATPPGKN